MELNYALQDNGDYILSSCILTDEQEFLLPASYNGKPIIGIGKKCFKNCKNLKKVVLNSNIKSIEKDAFYNCPLFEELDVYKSTCVIHNLMFNKCPNLDKIYILDSYNKSNFYQFLIRGVSYTKYNFSGDKISVWMVKGAGSIFALIKNLESEYDEKFAIGGKDIKVNENGLCYFLNDNNEAIIAGLTEEKNDADEEIVIPGNIDGHIVIGIADFAFYKSSFKTLIIPETVIHIGYFAFGCCAFDYIKFPSNYSGFRKDIFCEISLEDLIYIPKHSENFFIVELPDNINEDIYDSIDDNLNSRYKFICTEKRYSKFNISNNSSFAYDSDKGIAYIKNKSDIEILYMKMIDKKIKIPNVIDGKNVKYINASLCEYMIDVFYGDRDLVDKNLNKIVLPNVLPIQINQDFILKDDYDCRFWVLDRKICINYHSVIYDKKLNGSVPNALNGRYSGLYLLQKGSQESKKYRGKGSFKHLHYVGNEIKNKNITYLKVNSNDYLRELHYSSGEDDEIVNQFRYYINELAFIINIDPIDGIIEIPDAVDGIPVIGCAINIEEENSSLSIVLNDFIRDNPTNFYYFNPGTNHNINVFMKYDSKSFYGFMQICEYLDQRIENPHAYYFYNRNEEVHSLITDFIKNDVGKEIRNVTYVYLPKNLRSCVRYGYSGRNYFKDKKIICSNKIKFKPKLPKSAKIDFYK